MGTKFPGSLSLSHTHTPHPQQRHSHWLLVIKSPEVTVPNMGVGSKAMWVEQGQTLIEGILKSGARKGNPHPSLFLQTLFNQEADTQN